MGVYIDMEMPTACGYCPCARIFGCICMAAKRSFDKYPFDNIEDWCPLVPGPEPHGDLIDRNALLEGEGRYSISLCKEGIDAEEILRAKTVIPASEDGET